MEYIIAFFVALVVLAVIVNPNSNSASDAELIYDNAIHSDGREKLEYAEKYARLMETCEQKYAGKVFDFGIDIFSQDISLSHIDPNTKELLYPFAIRFTNAAQRHGIRSNWDAVFFKKRLLSEET
ncbi:hypothetical protein [Pseudohongiella acticola]|uniref:hypothetical protein n=1 Tax=Pseudohongiella acticola TaxID=1524254 RepID=UPI0030EF8803